MADNLQTRRGIVCRLRQAREDTGYTSAEAFCKKHQLPLETYLRHESGDTAIKASAAIQYCKGVRQATELKDTLRIQPIEN